MTLRKKLRITSLIMLIVAVLFVGFALRHPEMGVLATLISVETTWVFYKSYVGVIIGLFVVSFFVK